MENNFGDSKNRVSKKMIISLSVIAGVLFLGTALWYWSARDAGPNPPPEIPASTSQEQQGLTEEQAALQAELEKIKIQDKEAIQATAAEIAKETNNECVAFFADNDFANPDKQLLARVGRDDQNSDAFFGYILGSSVEKKDYSRCAFMNGLRDMNREGDCNLWYWLSRLLDEKCSDAVKTEISRDVVERLPKLYPGEPVINFVDGFCSAIAKKDPAMCDLTNDTAMVKYACRAIAGDDPAQCKGIRGGSVDCESFYYFGKMFLNDFKEDLTNNMGVSKIRTIFRMAARILKDRATVPFGERVLSAWDGFCSEKARGAVTPEFQK
jgi:hypothetical protein